MTWRWFQKARAKNIPISGPIICEKALHFANELGVEDFKASTGWLDSWKHRHSIKSFVVSGESADVDLQKTDDYKRRLPEICEGYDACDIFNCDETGLFFRALPDKTLSAKRQSSKGGKHIVHVLIT